MSCSPCFSNVNTIIGSKYLIFLSSSIPRIVQSILTNRR